VDSDVPEPALALQPDSASKPAQAADPESTEELPPEPQTAPSFKPGWSNKKLAISIVGAVVGLGLILLLVFGAVIPGLDRYESISSSSNKVTSLAYSPTGERLAVGVEYGVVGLLDVGAGKYNAVLPPVSGTSAMIHKIAWGPRDLLACGYGTTGKGAVELWQINDLGTNRKHVHTIRFKTRKKERYAPQPVSYLGFTKNGKYVVVYDSTDKKIRFWRARGKYSAQRSNPIKIAADKTISAASIDTEEFKLLAVVDELGSVFLWGKNKYKRSNKTATLHEGGIFGENRATNVALNPDGQWIVFDREDTPGSGSRVLITHMIDVGAEGSIPIPGKIWNIDAMVVSPDSSQVALSVKNRLIIMDVNSGQAIYDERVSFIGTDDPLEYILEEFLDMFDFDF
jgi:WD40 repeat protein